MTGAFLFGFAVGALMLAWFSMPRLMPRRPKLSSTEETWWRVVALHILEATPRRRDD
jgi:hypothetical protein